MEMWLDQIYETVMGLREEGYAAKGIENLFAEGKPCDRLYAQVYDAKNRVNRKLGGEENPDLEQMIQNLLEITKIVGYKMYSYGLGDGE